MVPSNEFMAFRGINRDTLIGKCSLPGISCIRSRFAVTVAQRYTTIGPVSTPAYAESDGKTLVTRYKSDRPNASDLPVRGLCIRPAQNIDEPDAQSGRI